MEKYNSNSIEKLLKSPRSVITDAINQFNQFKYFSGDEIRALIKKYGVKTLEDYLVNNGMDYYKEDPIIIIKKIREFKPTVFSEYNNLIEKLKSPTLSTEEYLQILEEAKKLI